MSEEIYTVPKPGDLPPPINSKDEAKAWAIEQVEVVEALRARCNISFPAQLDSQGKHLLVRQQQRAERQWLVKLGGALGVLGTLLRLGQIEADAYAELHSRVLDTMAATAVGQITP